MSSAITHDIGTGKEPCVDAIEFGILNEREIRGLSVCTVTDPIVYDRNVPRVNGVNDLRMGTVDRRLRCGTCTATMDECPGHFGHLELPAPCYNVGFMDMVLKSLRSVCFFCSRGLMSAEDPRVAAAPARGRARLNALSQLARSRRGPCAHCGGPQPTYTHVALAIRTDFGEDVARLFADDSEREFATRPFTAFDAHSILTHVPDGDLELLGFVPKRARPADMVMTVMLVPPPIVRPAIMAVEGSRSRGQDDLTIKIQEIVKASQVMTTAIRRDGGPSLEAAVSRDVATAWETLQYHVATIHNNDVRGLRQSLQRSGAPARCLHQRLKGKEGRIRGNLMGKRVNFSARSVISGDPIIDPDEVGVPEAAAMTLTVPERVTPWNVDDLSARVNAGPRSVAGARSVITGDGRLVDLAHTRQQVRLQYGWTVERYLRDGDVVVFNRQPSLHKMSMMGHRVRVMPESTFRLNLVCCPPYNADFDGDEMNLHVPQSESALAEVAELMMVPTQLINPQNNRPVMGIVQDALVGAFLLTRRSTLLTEGDAASLRLWIRHGGHHPPQAPAVLWPLRRYTGKQMLSEVVPAVDIGALVREGTAPPPWRGFDDADERRVLIRGGRVLSGALCGRMLKTSHGGVVHRVAREHGAQAAVAFMGDCQRVVNQWLALQGFGVGAGDCVVGAAGEAAVEAVVAGIRQREGMLRAVADAHGGPEVCGAELEAATSKLLAGALNEVGGAVRANLSPRNALSAMVCCGSKGSPINLSQIMGCVGQQSVEGRRIGSDLGAGAAAVLPCFRPDDQSPEARAFVPRAYAQGLRPREFFAHAMGGREGLVDTAVKTASTGYTQRKLMKALESLRVGPDGAVRHSVGTIVQMRYGGDGLDATQIETVAWDGLLGPTERLLADLRLKEEEGEEGEEGEEEEREGGEWLGVKDALRAEREAVLAAREELRAERVGRGGDAERVSDRLHVAFDPARVLRAARIRFGRHTRARTDLSPPDVVASADRLCGRLLTCGTAPEHTAHVRALVRRAWICRRVLQELRLDGASLRWAEGECVRRQVRAVVACGEMVGAIGAESIGEPCTQLTLNTFHFSGNMEKNVTLGVPRLRELLDATKKIRTPIATLRPLDDTRAGAERLAASVAATTLRDLLAGELRQCDDDDPRDAVLTEATSPFSPPPPSPGLTLRAEFDPQTLRLRGLLAEDVAEIVERALRAESMPARCDACSQGPWGAARIRVRPLGEECATKAADRAHAALVCGSRAVRAAAPVERQCHEVAPEDGAVRERAEHVVVTEGCALYEALAHEGVDWRTVTCNSVHDVLDTLGVEAAVAVLFREIRCVLGFDGTYINMRHIMLVADAMAMRGKLMPVSRHGINRIPTGPLSRASFEETLETLLEAGGFAETDDIVDVSEHIMVGGLAPVGTGACRVEVDVRTMPQNAERDEGARGDVVRSFVTRPYRPAIGAAETPLARGGECGAAATTQALLPHGQWGSPYVEEEGAAAHAGSFVPIASASSNAAAPHMSRLRDDAEGEAETVAPPPPRRGGFRPSSPERGASLTLLGGGEAAETAEAASVYDATGRIDFGALQKLLARLRR